MLHLVLGGPRSDQGVGIFRKSRCGRGVRVWGLVVSGVSGVRWSVAALLHPGTNDPPDRCQVYAEMIGYLAVAIGSGGVGRVNRVVPMAMSGRYRRQ